MVVFRYFILRFTAIALEKKSRFLYIVYLNTPIYILLIILYIKKSCKKL